MIGMEIEIQDVNRVAHYKNTRDILYIKSSEHILIVKCDESSITTRQYSLGELQDVLYKGFVRCHRQYIVNISKIESYDKTLRILRLEVGDIPVGRAYKKQLEKALEERCISEKVSQKMQMT